MVIYFFFCLLSVCVAANVSVVEKEPLCNPNRLLQVDTGKCVNSTGIEISEILQKCCPPGYSYHAKQHHCVRSVYDNYFFKWNYLRVGLRNCRNGMIKDSWIETLPDILSSSGDRCFDKLVDEDGFVQRVCEDVEEFVCNKSETQCIRKCCPDLEVFANGPHCRPKIEGVNFFGAKKIEINKGKSKFQNC